MQSPARLLTAILGGLYGVIAVGFFFSGAADDRIVSLLLIPVWLIGVVAALVVRLRPGPMVILFYILSLAQSLVLVALLAAEVGNPGLIAFLNVALVAGMLFAAGLFRLEAEGSADPS